MSKVLIDRAVLEATLEHAEFVSGAACEADDAIRAVLVAPSGTPVMPVKAYYHEAPNEHGGLNKSVGLEQRKTFADAPLVLESDALVQIACLEGEIAKRDARIVELENAAESLRISRDYHHEQEVEYRRRWAGLNAAPVSEAKAQGVVQWPEADEIMQMAFEEGQPADDASGYCFELEEFDLFIERLMSEVARLNAAPVQQVSVQGGLELIKRMQVCLSLDDTEWGLSAPEKYKLLGDIKSYVLAATAAPAAPAAPAADAGLVEALDRIARSAASHIEQGERPDLVTVSHWACVAFSAIDAREAV